MFRRHHRLQQRNPRPLARQGRYVGYQTYIDVDQCAWPASTAISPHARPTGSKKADVMATLNSATIFVPLRASRVNHPRGRASYAGSVTEMQLRQALAQAEAQLREKDLLVDALLAWRESAANRLIGLTPRQRQVMDMVLAGQPSKNIAADLGISQRTVENHRAAIIKRTGSKCLPALARMAFAADRNGVPALPSLSDPLNTENPDRESSRKPPADRYSEAAAGLTGRSSRPANQARFCDSEGTAVLNSSMSSVRQSASITRLPIPARCRSR